MRVMVGAAAVVLVGCNQLFGLEPGSGVDAAGVDAADADVEVDAPTSFGPWGNATPVLADPVMHEDDGILTADGGELIYAASTVMAPGKDLRRAVFDGSVWLDAGPIDTLNSTVTDSTPRFGADDLSIYLATDRPVTMGLTDIWRATRDSLTSEWNTPVAAPELSSTRDDRTPSPCLAESRFIMLSDRNGAIQLLELVPGQFSTTIPVGTLMPVSPFVTEDCLTLYFAGLVNGAIEYDLYVTRRPALDQPWSEPLRIDELTTTANETDPWLSADGRHLLFSRDTTGNSDILEAFRDPL